MTHIHVIYDSPDYVVTSLGYGSVEIAAKRETPNGRQAHKAVFMQGEEASRFCATLAAAAVGGMEYDVCSAYDGVMKPLNGEN